MSRQINKAESYATVHQSFSQINFNAFDYDTVKKSLIDYLKIYHPEDFNDFIESSELIAIIETFAYVAELLSYRIDINAQENFMSTAQRKESILRLAKLVSYKPTRNIPHRGLVKITAIKTTEPVFDIDGENLANKTINWNDSNNVKWRDQFIQLMNQVLSQPFGTVGAGNRAQVDNVLFELYTLSNTALTGGNSSIFPYSARVSDSSLAMELVPSRLTEDGPVERRPEVSAPFSLLYATDGLGDGSDTSGFLALTKQGILQKREAFFDGITPNQALEISVENINNTDVFVNNVNSDDRELLSTNPFGDLLRESNTTKFGEWFEVGADNYESVIFNSEDNRRKFEVETLENDAVRIIFGDGEFSQIPNGAFDIWFRSSANQDITIPKASVIGQESSFSYQDSNGGSQTFTFTFSLINALQNNSVSESIEHIRRVAPSVYYTQDRMVNARDYNSHMLQDPRIVKMKAINRTFAGDSKYIAWHDPKEYYEDTKLFGNDLALFKYSEPPINGTTTLVNTAVEPEELVEDTIEPLLNSIDFFVMVVSKLEELNKKDKNYKTVFNNKEVIIEALESLINDSDTDSIDGQVSLYYSVADELWYVNAPDTERLLVFQIQPTFVSGNILSGWTINQATESFVAYSDTTRFWNTNGPDTVLNINNLLNEADTLTVLGANLNSTKTGLLENDIKFNVTKQEEFGIGTNSYNSLSILPIDQNSDDIPDDLTQSLIFGDLIDSRTLTSDPDVPASFELPTEYLQGFENEDVVVYVIRGGALESVDIDSANRVKLEFGSGWTTPAIGDPINTDVSTILRTWIQIQPSKIQPNDVYLIKAKKYVYLKRDTINDPFAVQPDTDNVKLLYFQEATTGSTQRRYNRYEGRFPLNFSWFHSTPRLHLIDPAPSNIIDMFVITDGYYRDHSAYLNEVIDYVPEKPSSYTLKQTFRELLKSKMISDTIVMHSGNLRPIFGTKATNEDRAKIKIIISSQNTFSDNDIKNQIISIIKSFFDISSWNFGETFYFSELSAAIHAQLNASIDSVVLVPVSTGTQFGDLYQIDAREDEIFVPDINASDIEIVTSLTATNINQ